MLNRRVFRATIAIAAGALVYPVPGSGQQFNGRVVFTPYAGVFVPAGYLGRVTDTDFGSGKIRAEAAAAVGATLSYWMTENTALEFGGAYAFSDMQNKFSGTSWKPGLGPDLSAHAYTLVGSARLMYNVIPAEYNWRLRIGAGPAIISRGGKAFDPTEGKITGKTDVGGVASLCTRIPLMENVAIRIRAEDYIYQANMKFEGPASTVPFGKRVQNDLLFSAGLQFVLRK